MDTNNKFRDHVKSLIGGSVVVVVDLGGQKLAAKVGMLHGDYVTLVVDKALLTSNAPVPLSDVPDGRSTQIEVPLSAISWVGRAPRS